MIPATRRERRNRGAEAIATLFAPGEHDRIPPMTETQRAFQLEEYKALRKEVEIYLTEVRSHERYTVIAAGLTWGWLIVNHNSHWLLWSIPALIAGAAAFRMVAINIHFRTLSAHIARIEEDFGVLGWERLAENRPLNIGASSSVLAVLLFLLACFGWFIRSSLAASVAPK